MAQKIITTLTDDIDGSEAAETVRFAIDGGEYEIDLSEENAAKLRESIALYVAHARTVGGRRGQRRASRDGSPRKSDKADAKAVRAWAREAGIDVPARGRIPQAVYEQYSAAH